MVRKITAAFVLLFLSPVLLFPQILRRPLAAPYAGLGAYSLNHADVFSFTANQASLAQVKNTAAGVYAERRFFLSELNDYTAVTCLLTKSGNFAVQVHHTGSADYSESQFGLAYGRSLGKKADIGTQFNYNTTRISGYGNASAISFELGTILHLTERLHAGVHVSNPVGGKFGKTRSEKLSSVFVAGFGFDASEKFFTGFEIEKEEGQPVNVHAGLQYKFMPHLLARTGISSATSSVWAGLGFTFKSFRVDISSSYHPQLGISPGLLFLFNFNKREN